MIFSSSLYTWGPVCRSTPPRKRSPICSANHTLPVEPERGGHEGGVDQGALAAGTRR